jgi:hypothetical protein
VHFTKTFCALHKDILCTSQRHFVHFSKTFCGLHKDILCTSQRHFVDFTKCRYLVQFASQLNAFCIIHGSGVHVLYTFCDYWSQVLPFMATLETLLGASAKLRKATISFIMFVRPSPCRSVYSHGTTRLPLDGYLWHLIFENFLKICRKNSSFIKIGKKGYFTWRQYTFWSYLAHLFLVWEMFQTKVVEKIKTHIMCSVTFLFENRTVYEKIWKKIL